MSAASPLKAHILFHIGPVPIAQAVLVTWGIMLGLTLACLVARRRLAVRPSRPQAFLELVVVTIQRQIRETIEADPAPYLPLIGTIFIFVLAANWSSLIPGVEPPTGTLETDAALALIVFTATIVFGVRTLGAGGYLRSFARPSIFVAPINLLELFTRSLSLTVRLFGNVMSGMFMIAVLLGLAGLLVPIPLMALELMTGAIQAYIFATLATVFIGSAAAEAEERDRSHTKQEHEQ